MKKQLASIAVLLLAGCATPQPIVWHKPGGTEEQFRRDVMSCRQYGMQSAQANGLSGNMFVEMWISREAEGCMRSLGYSTGAKPQDPAKAVEHLQLPKIDQTQKGLPF